MGTKAEAAWKLLFDRFPLRQELAERGWVEITADQIKAETGQEPRLVTKFDARETRPPALKQVSILAVRNGVYRLLAGDAYVEVPKDAPAVAFSPRAIALETFPRELTTESQVLDHALVYGMLEHCFDERRIFLTSRGRRRARPFELAFATAAHGVVRFVADGVQVEVDGGYEGSRIYVVEAKLGLRTNFHLRQLYYPLRLWQAEGATKPIVPVFVTYSNRELRILEYRFTAPDALHSIELVRSSAYSLDAPRALPTLDALLHETRPEPEPDALPFPQADDPRRIIDVVVGVAADLATYDAITLANDFAERQARYYTAAAEYLGLIALDRRRFTLTPAGRRFVAATRSDRWLQLARAMLCRRAVRTVVDARLAGASDAVAQRALRKRRPELGGTTIARRVATVDRWLAWLVDTFARG
jgi:hypothetical protein